MVTPEQCRALVNWMSILDREYPQVNFRATALDILARKAANLFRDEYFQPFYGKPIAQTSDNERLQYHRTVFRGCGPNHLTEQELATFQKFRILVERPFLYGSATFPYQQFARDLAQYQTLARWRDEALQGLNALPATLEGFDTLETYRQKGEKDLENLFPGEKRQFLQAIAERRKALAPALAEQLIQSAGAVPAGTDGAKAIAASRAKCQRYLSEADPAVKRRVEARLDELTSAALRQPLARQKAKLAALPAGIDGALAVLTWRREFDIEFAGVAGTAEIQALQGEAAAKRRQCLGQGIAEFKTLAAEYPKPGGAGLKADDLLAKLFPANDPPPPEEAQYRALFAARVDQLKTAEQAKAAAAKPLSKPAAASADASLHPCDALAGHPGDPGHKGDGVYDSDLNAAEAIKQCALAVKQQPKNARFRFQLGRAYWVAKQYTNAVPMLASAQAMEYAAAYHYLGMAYEQGRVKGEPADKVFAADLYKLAIAGGFDAEAVLVSSGVAEPPPVVEKPEDLDAAVFKEPAWVRALFAGDMDTLNRSRTQVLTYIRGMHEFISLDPNEFDESCEKLADASVGEKLDFEQTGVGDGKVNMNVTLSEAMRLLKSSPRMVMAEAERNERTSQNGVDDMNVLSEDYGSCAGPVVQRVYSNIKRFLREKPQRK